MIFEDLRVVFSDFKKWLWLVLISLPCLYFLSGFYSVDVDQRAYVTRFGKLYKDNVSSGMHYRLPWPIEQVKVVDTPALKSKLIEFSVKEGEKVRSLELITADANLVDSKVELQYSVVEVMKFDMASENVDLLVKEFAKVEIIYQISQKPFEELLTTGRTQFQDRVKSSLQRVVEKYDLGVRITGVQISLLEPPKSIKKTFDDVSSAQSEKQKLIQEARGERGTRLAKARSESNRTTSSARAESSELVKRAEGDVQRFDSRLAANNNSSGLFMKRFYWQAIEEIFKEAELTVISPDKSQ